MSISRLVAHLEDPEEAKNTHSTEQTLSQPQGWDRERLLGNPEDLFQTLLQLEILKPAKVERETGAKCLLSSPQNTAREDKLNNKV